jgi:hypothetical protein
MLFLLIDYDIYNPNPQTVRKRPTLKLVTLYQNVR